MTPMDDPPDAADPPSGYSNDPNGYSNDPNGYLNDLELAVSAAREAGRVALRHYGRVERLTKTHAATTDEPVTVADREAQRAIVERLRLHHPSDGLIGEESDTGESITAEKLETDGRTWVIDPIDGTNNFIAGLGNWAICIGLLDAGRPVVGVVYDVTRDVMHAGCAGSGASLNGRPCHATRAGMSAASVVMLTSNLLGPGNEPPQWACDLIGQTHWKIRMLGSAALEAAAVGAGIADAAVTINGKLWDCVAPAAFTLAAGGSVTKPDGTDLFPFDVAGYRGAKVPFVAAGVNARDEFIARVKS
jgi:myo-inositol-1(or 4)-monophosphatase